MNETAPKMAEELTAPAPSTLPAVANEAASILTTINKMANRKDIDPERLDKMISLYERVQSIQAKAEFAQALAEMQPRLPIISERGKILSKKGGVQSRYAYYEDIIEDIAPLLAEYGFAITFETAETKDGEVALTTILMHRSGHEKRATIPMPIDKSDYRNGPQNIASSLSYSKRYGVFSVLNIVTRGEDDDGQAAGVVYITNAQRDELQDLLDQIIAITRDNEAERLCQFLGVESLAVIPAKLFDKARHACKAELAKHRKGADNG